MIFAGWPAGPWTRRRPYYDSGNAEILGELPRDFKITSSPLGSCRKDAWNCPRGFGSEKPGRSMSKMRRL